MKKTKKKTAPKKKNPAKPKAGKKKTLKKKNAAAAPSSFATAGSFATADPASSGTVGQEVTDLVCPICKGEIRLKVAFSNIYCGYHLVPDCPGKCAWPDEYRWGLMRRVTELHYEHPELFKTDTELTEESFARLKERER